MVDTNNRVWAASTPGKRHDPADVRRDIFQSSGGASGLVAAGGGGVGLTPGTPMSVRLEPCSVRIRSEVAGRSDEAYSFSVKSPQDVPIRTTGSGGGRVDVVALIVSDPILEGMDVAETDAEGNVIEGSEGLDPNDHDYWAVEVFENVPTSAARTTEAFRQWARDNNRARAGVAPYAKVEQGANSTGLEGKVTPFYDSILGRSKTIPPIIVNIPGEQSISPSDGSTYYAIGPIIPMDIPEWATHVTVSLQATGMFIRNNSQPAGSAGYLRGSFLNGYTYLTRWDMDADQGRITRGTYTVAGRFEIPASQRGNTRNLRLQGTNERTGVDFGVNSGSTYIVQATFEELP